MIKRNLGAAFLLGAIFGGLVHMWFMLEAAIASFHRYDIDTFGWNTKPPGDIFEAYVMQYLMACAFVVINVLFYSVVFIMRRISYRYELRWWPEPKPISAYSLAALLGAICAGGLNYWKAESDYRTAIADGVRIAADTVAVALPAMRDFTLAYCGALAALLALTSIGYLLLQRRRVLLPT